MTIFTLIAWFILQIGIDRYKLDLKDRTDFVEVEEKKIDQYVTFWQYGAYGLRILTCQPALSALSNNNQSLQSLKVFFDNRVNLKIYKSLIGKGIFKSTVTAQLDLSWFIIIIGSGLALAWGYQSFRNKPYLQYLANFTGEGNVYLGVVLARGLISRTQAPLEKR